MLTCKPKNQLANFILFFLWLKFSGLFVYTGPHIGRSARISGIYKLICWWEQLKDWILDSLLRSITVVPLSLWGTGPLWAQGGDSEQAFRSFKKKMWKILFVILFFNSLGQYLGKDQKQMAIAFECEVWWSVEKALLFSSSAAIECNP